MRVFEPLISPLIGYTVAGFSTAMIHLAEVTSHLTQLPKSSIEVGGTIGLIGGLSYGCLTLWKEIQTLKREAREDRDRYHADISDLNREIRNERREQNDKLIDALNQLAVRGGSGFG